MKPSLHRRCFRSAVMGFSLIHLFTNCHESWAAGTISLCNSVFNRVTYYSLTGELVPLPTTPGLLNFGLRWGTNLSALSIVYPVASNSTQFAGLIDTPCIYAIPGTEAGQTIYLQVFAWPPFEARHWLYGITPIISITLGPETGPAPPVWQGAAGTDPSRFRPLTTWSTGPPPLIIAFPWSIIIDEGSAGPLELIIRVVRSMQPVPSLEFPVTVLVSTEDLTAKAGQDYVPLRDHPLTFNPGETNKALRITLLPDSIPEEPEEFKLHLRADNPAWTLLFDGTVRIRESRIISGRWENNRFLVTLQTSSRQSYAVEVSSDLVSWSTLDGAENILGTGEPVEVVDYALGNSQRYYRLRILE